MQTSFTRSTYVNGQHADNRPRSVISRVNELLAQESRVTNAGTTDGIYTFTITGEEGSFVGTYTASSDTTLEILQGIIDDLETQPDAVALFTFTAVDTGTDYARIVSKIPGRSYTVVVNADAGGTMAHVLTQAAGGTDIPIGRAVVRGTTSKDAKLPNATSVSSDCLGIVRRGSDLLIYDSAEANTLDRVPPGGVMEPVEMGSIAVSGIETAWLDGEPVFVRRIASTSQDLGALRNSSDGTAHVETLTPTAENSTHFGVMVRVNMGENVWQNHFITMNSGGGATATSICNALRADLLIHPELAELITGTGTATCILTGNDGVEFSTENFSEGVIAVAVTAAGTFETFCLVGAHFEGDGAIGGTAKIVLKR
jgi:hypothetical protein